MVMEVKVDHEEEDVTGVKGIETIGDPRYQPLQLITLTLIKIQTQWSDRNIY